MPKRIHIVLFVVATISAFSLQPAYSQDWYKALKLLQGAYKTYEAFTITDEELAESMHLTMGQYDSENKVCSENSQYAKRIKRITKNMTEIDGIPLNFKVYISDEANAFASPDGSVRIYSKLMDIMTDDEVLGVIGHELGHLEGRHSLKEYKAALLVSAARDGLLATDSKIGEIAASGFGDLTEVLLNSKYSRDQEREADRYGYEYLKDIGKDPTSLAKALRKLLAIQDDPNGPYYRYIVHLFSTHPDLEERIEILDEMDKNAY